MYFTTILKKGSFRDRARNLFTTLSTQRASLVAQLVKNPAAIQETSVRILSQEDPLENVSPLKSSWASLVAQTVKNPPAMRETWVPSWVGKIPWRRKWQATPIFLPGESYGQRSLAGNSPWGCKESRVTKHSPFQVDCLLKFLGMSRSGMCMCVSCSVVSNSWDPRTVAGQAPLFMGSSRQEYWSGLPFPSSGNLPNPGIKPGLLHCREILYHLIHQGSPENSVPSKLTACSCLMERDPDQLQRQVIPSAGNHLPAGMQTHSALISEMPAYLWASLDLILLEAFLNCVTPLGVKLSSCVSLTALASPYYST